MPIYYFKISVIIYKPLSSLIQIFAAVGNCVCLFHFCSVPCPLTFWSRALSIVGAASGAGVPIVMGELGGRPGRRAVGVINRVWGARGGAFG